MRTNITRWISGSVLVLVLGVSAQMQEPKPEPQPKPGRPAADMSDKCKAMMAEHEKVMSEVKAADERLDGLVSRMNAASEEQKADATAAVVTEMVAQRKKMRDRMMGMQEGSMSHMMEHMQAGPRSMADCPMMKRSGATKS